MKDVYLPRMWLPPDVCCTRSLNLLLSIVILPTMLLLFMPIVVAFASPAIVLGVCGSDSATSPVCLGLRRLPYLVPMVLFVDLPIAIVFIATDLIEGLFLRNPVVLVVYGLCRRFTQLPDSRPFPDIEAAAHVCPSCAQCRTQLMAPAIVSTLPSGLRLRVMTRSAKATFGYLASTGSWGWLRRAVCSHGGRTFRRRLS